MSVKVHEAYSLDSSQDRLLWWDDFLGDQLQDEWTVAGTAVVIDAQTGGIVRLTTGAVSGDPCWLDWGTIKTLLVSKKLSFEYRVKLETASFINIEIFVDDGTWTKYARFHYDTGLAHTNWQIAVRDTGTTSADSGVVVDDLYHIFRIECFPTGEVHFYIDGVETTNSPITVAANIPNEYLMPRFFIRTRENAAKHMDLDYVVVRQEV